MLKQYVLTEEELEKIKGLVKDSHDVIWVDVPRKGLTSSMRQDVLVNLSKVLELLGDES